MGAGTEAWAVENKLPPAKKETNQSGEFYITVFFSIYPRYDMLDPKDSVFNPEKVFNKPHQYNVIRWEDGEATMWENGQVKKELKKQDKVFYIDCSDIIIDCLFQDISKIIRAMSKKMKDAVDFTLDFLNLKYVQGFSGTVHFNLCGHMPFDPMVFAWRKLFDDSKQSDKYYTNFCSIMNKVFKKTIQRYTNSGFSFVTDYTCIMEGYGLLTRPAYNKKKFEEIEVYRKELGMHNNRIHKNERHNNPIIYNQYKQVIEPSHAYELLNREHVERVKKLQLDYFVYQEGTEKSGNSAINDKIFYHGRPYSFDELTALYNAHKEAWWEESKSPSLIEQIRKWWNDGKEMREWNDFQKYVESNAEVHEEGEAKMEEIDNTTTSLNNQANVESSDEHEAYEIGRKVHEADGLSKYYHDPKHIEYDSQYVDLTTLNTRYDRYKNAVETSDEFTRKKERESEERIAWYPIDVIWSVIRIGLGIASFFFPVLIFVDLALELIQLGVKLVARSDPFQWNDLIGVGVDLLCIWALRGGGSSAVFKNLKPGEQISGGTNAIKAANQARAESKASTEAILMETEQKIGYAQDQIALQAQKIQQSLPENEGQIINKINELLNDLKYNKHHYDNLVKNSDKLANKAGAIVYEEELSKMNTFSKFVEDGKMFYANYDKLSLSGKVQYAAGFFVKNFGGNAFTAKGIHDNLGVIIDKNSNLLDYTVYSVSDNSFVMIQ